MNRSTKEAISILRKASRAETFPKMLVLVDRACALLLPPRKRPPKKVLPKALQSTKPARQIAHRESTKSIRAAVMERSHGWCELGVACAAGEGRYQGQMELHHLEGGSGRRRQAQSVSNTLMACRACHRGYHHDPETFRFAVEEWAKAFNYPVPSRFRRAALPRRGTA